MKSTHTVLMLLTLLAFVPGCPWPPKPDPGPDPGRKLDSDGDGITDVDEIERGSDPEDCADPNPSGCPDKPGVPDDSLDSDGDGIPDSDEIILGSDPKDCADPFASGCSDGRELPDDEPDSDGDGISDDDETRVGTDPFDCADPLPAGCPDKPGPDDLCANVTDCNDGDLCTSDACVPDVGCVNTPISCPSGQECDPDTGSCVTSGCTTNADCNNGEVCNEGTCEPDGSECRTNADCLDDGLFCNGAEICDEAGACSSSGDSCPTDEFCNETSNTCDECRADSDCAGGKVCNEGICELDGSQCQTNADCLDDGLYCNGTEFCGADGVCSSPGDPCLADEFCNEASDTCDECRVDADCADGQICIDLCVWVEPNTYTLTVEKSGLGWGTITGPGIDFGTDATEDFEAGTIVTLTAEAGSGAGFSSWSGCDSVDGTSCTVTMNADRLVTATFTFGMSSSITIVDLPSTSSDGNYTLTWTVTGLGSSNYTILEDSSAAFPNPATYVAGGTSYTFTDKPDGTYWYKVQNTTSSSAPASIIVSRPTGSTLRVINDLYDRTESDGTDWSKLNTLIWVRIGPNEQSVLSSNTYERLYQGESTSNVANLQEMLPAYGQETSYRDFDVSAYAPDYFVFIQTGWWDYDVYSRLWNKHASQVLACDGSCCLPKWTTISITDHTSGTFSIKASDFLAHGHWYGTRFCN